MEAWKRLWALILTIFLVIPTSSTHPLEHQSDDWRETRLLGRKLHEQYLEIGPGRLVMFIALSPVYTAVGIALNGLEGFVNNGRAVLRDCYEQHLRDPVEEIKAWIEAKDSTGRVKDFFKKFDS
ncbi:uncharacterized protein LOC144766554 [Lissotriton helveticus]